MRLSLTFPLIKAKVVRKSLHYFLSSLKKIYLVSSTSYFLIISHIQVIVKLLLILKMLLKLKR